MKTIIAGSRDIFDFDRVEWATGSCGWAITEVVSGGAPGVDALGERWAKPRRIPIRRFPADWHTHGKAAGPIRNRQMAQYAEACIVIHNGSRGAASMIAEAKRAGLKLFTFYTRPDAKDRGNE